MSTHPVLYLHPSTPSILGLVVSRPNPALGEILEVVVRALDRALADCAAELAALRASKWAAPTFEVVTLRDYVKELHSLSDFPAYTSARVDRNDEPLFARELWRGDVVTFQGQRHVVRKSVKRAICGDYFVTLEKGDGVSSSLLTLVAKALPANKLWSVKRHPRGEDTTPSEVQPLIQQAEGCCAVALRSLLWSASELPKTKAEVRFHQVTPEDVAWAEREWKNVAGISASQNAIFREFTEPLIDWCPNCYEYVSGNHDAKGIACKKHVAKQAAKAAKTVEDYHAKWNAVWQRKRLKMRRMMESQRHVYSPEEFDLDIIEARGRYTADAITELDRKMWKTSPRAKCKYRIQ